MCLFSPSLLPRQQRGAFARRYYSRIFQRDHFTHYLREEFKMGTKLVTSRMRTEQWGDIIKDSKESGLKVDDYCAQRGPLEMHTSTGLEK